MPHHLWQAIKQEVTQMLQLDIIEESHSPWRAPLIIEPKLDGNIRVCVYFRKVNEVAIFDIFLMPRVEEMLEKIGQAKYITMLDLTKGYWQIPVTPMDKEKTAFGMHWGLFQFNRMPFGLHGAAASFQCLMDRTLAPHQTYADAYINDIIIFSADREPHCHFKGTKGCRTNCKSKEM